LYPVQDLDVYLASLKSPAETDLEGAEVPSPAAEVSLNMEVMTPSSLDEYQVYCKLKIHGLF
jgi:hypothetical protein